jgi:hypothetical protein
MIEWKDVNNIFIDPDTILDSYSKNVWRICSKCNNSYEMSPKFRLMNKKRNLESCGNCKGYRKPKIHFF